MALVDLIDTIDFVTFASTFLTVLIVSGIVAIQGGSDVRSRND